MRLFRRSRSTTRSKRSRNSPLARPSLRVRSERAILEILLQREKLGSTAVGNGVAIPHGKLPKLGRLFGLFARLERPIDFEALDGQPVDLIFLLLAPEAAGADHLKALARVARLLRDPEIARKLRELARCRRALCRAGDAGGKQRGVTTPRHSRLPIQFSGR